MDFVGKSKIRKNYTNFAGQTYLQNKWSMVDHGRPLEFENITSLVDLVHSRRTRRSSLPLSRIASRHVDRLPRRP
jgi:hypothetical protein